MFSWWFCYRSAFDSLPLIRLQPSPKDSVILPGSQLLGCLQKDGTFLYLTLAEQIRPSLTYLQHMVN
jgi:hypothetical protein